jgi:hypothetical protein
VEGRCECYRLKEDLAKLSWRKKKRHLIVVLRRKSLLLQTLDMDCCLNHFFLSFSSLHLSPSRSR